MSVSMLVVGGGPPTLERRCRNIGPSASATLRDVSAAAGAAVFVLTLTLNVTGLSPGPTSSAGRVMCTAARPFGGRALRPEGLGSVFGAIYIDRTAVLHHCVALQCVA